VTYRKILDYWWIVAGYLIVGASFPWAGLMALDGQPFDAMVLFFNAHLAFRFLKGLEI